MKSFGISCLFFLGFSLLESAFLSNILILPAIPDLVLLCSLYLSLNNGRLFGSCAGFAGGLFLDFFSAVPFGLNCLLRTVFGYTAGLFSKTLNINGVFFPFLLGALSTIFKAVILWCITVFYPNVSIAREAVSFSFGFEVLFNALLAPLVFKFLDVFKGELLLAVENVR
ncbi:rod shape-determining protein MreD [uncultured Treponema sp.]|uniref:rod shape-determining protein MreD n=1 Tax=uncultured Treponema sp. TaxID=162155 RepID=UPI0015B7B5F3|nr:rod shape-determining protein MreD [uncultured Treponema sp.]